MAVSSDEHQTMQIHALLSVTFISFAPILALLILPVDNKVYLKKLLALAAGCLLGDSFLHLIPESAHLQGGHEPSHEHNHDHHEHSHEHHDHHNHHEHVHQGHGHSHAHDNSVGLKVLAGIVIFIVLEKFIYSMKSHSSDSKKASKSKKKKDDDYEPDGHDHGHIDPSGILNLIADFLHNFTDGLAIGASFASGTKLGISTTFAIFLHEVPHEIGDYAILIQSGFPKRTAILLQAVTAIGAISGTIISLLLGHRFESANGWILPITAGGFIYIATVHLIPQLKNSNFKQTFVELICFVIGVGIMYAMAWLE